MSFKVDVLCYKCNTEFKVEKDTLPMLEEGGKAVKAICPECNADCGLISVTLQIVK